MDTLKSGRTLTDLIEQTSGLYSLPAVAVDVLALTSDPQVGATELKRCIERDPALVAKLLRVVNSALFGLSRPVTDLGQAITMLGVKPLKLLVLGFSLPRALTDDVQTQVLEGYWRHSLTKAVASRFLAEQLHCGSSDEAFLAGLLSDLGMLVLIQVLGEPYVQVVRRIHHLQRQLDEVERRALGFDHIELTVQLLRRWHMPPLLVDAIDSSVRHSDSSNPNNSAEEAAPPKGSLAEVLALAEQLTLVLVERQVDHFPQLLHQLHQRFDISADQLTNWSATIESRVVELADVLSLNISNGLDYVEIIREAHLRLGEGVCELATELLIPAGRRAERCNDSMLEAQVQNLMALAGDPWAAQRTNPLSARQADGANKPANAEPARNDRGIQQTPTQPTARREATPAPTASTAAQESAVTALDELIARVQRMSDDCRQARCPMSLVIVALDRDEQLRSELGLVHHASCCRHAATLSRQVDHWGAAVHELTMHRFAILLPNADRSQASDIGTSVLLGMRKRYAQQKTNAATMSVGVASLPMVPRNFSAEKLVLAAARCLQAAQTSGNCLKSIEI